MGLLYLSSLQSGKFQTVQWYRRTFLGERGGGIVEFLFNPSRSGFPCPFLRKEGFNWRLGFAVGTWSRVKGGILEGNPTSLQEGMTSH